MCVRIYWVKWEVKCLILVITRNNFIARGVRYSVKYCYIILVHHFNNGYLIKFGQLYFKHQLPADLRTSLICSSTNRKLPRTKKDAVHLVTDNNIYVHLYMMVEVYTWTTLVMYLLCGHWVYHFLEQQHWATFRGWCIIQRCEMFHRHLWIPHSTRFTGKHRGDRWCSVTTRARQDSCHCGSWIMHTGEVPLEVQWLDKVTSEVTAPRQITNVNTLLHVNRASLRPEQQMYWQAYHYPYSILCTHYTRAPVFSFTIPPA